MGAMSLVNVTSPAGGADCAMTTVDELELRIAPPTITADASTYVHPLFTANIPHAPFANSSEL